MPRSDLSRRALLAAGGALAVAPVANALRANPAAAAAPMLGRDEPTHYRFKLGDFEVTMIADSDAFVDGPWPLIGGNTKQADVQQLMQANLLPPDRYRPGFTPLVINTGNKILIFDTGNGERGFVPRPAGGWLATQLAPAGIQPEQVDVVVLSHGHPDHIGGVLEKGQAALSQCALRDRGDRLRLLERRQAHRRSGETCGPLSRLRRALRREDDIPEARRQCRARHPRHRGIRS